MTTIDLDRAAAELKEDGLCIVPGALDAHTLATARTALYDAAERDRAEGREVQFGLDYPTDTTNQRVWNLPNRHPVFCVLAEHPAALALVKGTLGWPALLSNISANITGPGGGEMVMHADQLYMPQPWSGIQGINVLWCLDDFTDENGGTRVVPGSHKLNRAPGARRSGRRDGRDRGARRARWSWSRAACGTRPATTAPPISGAPACSPGTRSRSTAAQENWFLVARRRGGRQRASDDLLVLFGYKAMGLGLVNGASPR